MPTVFLSYARKDGRAAASRLRAELELAGFQVWRDIENMQGGQAWKDQLRVALRAADAVVVLLTPASITSKNVEWEWENTFTLQKGVFPVLILDCDVPYELNRLHRHDLSKEENYKLGLDSLIENLFLVSGTSNSSGNASKQLTENHPLETLEINPDKIERVNSDLSFVENLQQKGYLDESQVTIFAKIKQEVHFLNEFNPKLEQLYLESKALLADARLSLAKKIEELKLSSEKTLDPENLLKLSQEKDCREGELRILQDFMDELEDSNLVAAWINDRAKALAKKLGREALDSFPEIRHNLNDEDVGYFCFSIYQFLEQISHCLRWGRYEILDSPDIPLVLDHSVYEKAFFLIKECIENDLPKRFGQIGKGLVGEYIDYLISRLHTYE